MHVSRTLFWRDHPKVRMQLSLLIGALFILVLLPAALFMTLQRGGFSFFSPLPALLCLFPLALAWGYAAFLLRRTFHCARRTAGAIALVCALPPTLVILLLACALKTKNRAALFAIAILLSAVTALACVLFMPLFAWQTTVSQTLSLVVLIAYIIAIAVSPSERRAIKWVVAPVLIYTLAMAFTTFTAAWLEQRANQLDAEFLRATGLQWTPEDAMAFYTNGTSMSTGPYAPLFAEKLPLSAQQKLKIDNLLDRFTQEDFEHYTAFIQANAETLALLDEVTNLADFRPAYDALPEAETFFYPSNSFANNWAQFYGWKINAAVFQGDTAMVMDCLHRLRNIQTWMEASPSYTDQAYALLVTSIRHRGIAITLPQLSRDALRELQAEFAAQLAGTDHRLRMTLMYQRVDMPKLLEYVESQMSRPIRMLRAVPCLPQMWAIWKNYERLVMLENLLHFNYIIDIGGPGVYTFLEAIGDQATKACFVTPVSRGMCHMFTNALQIRIKIDDLCRTALAGIAVERYRREHNALPASLNALVPEFLDSVPLAASTGAPLGYRSGEFDYAVDRTTTLRINGFEVHVESSGFRSPRFTVPLK